MNYAIIRNTKYTSSQLSVVYRHNERKNTNYSNKDINKQLSKVNYSIKECNTTYEKRFKDLKEEYDLQGKIKSISNVACEYIITASPEFFDGLADDEIKRYFVTAYKFVSQFKNLGEQYIISAKVHMDESNPHMHLVYLPVVHTMDKKSGQPIEKLCCTDFWKGKNSYKYLQDNFYKYMTKAGFDLDRGDTEDNKHLKIADLKRVTNYEVQKYQKEIVSLKEEINSENLEEVKKEYKRVIRKYNTLAKQYTRIKTISDSNVSQLEEVKEENEELKQENNELKKGVAFLKHYIDKALECVSLMFDFPKVRLKSTVDLFVKEGEKVERNISNKKNK